MVLWELRDLARELTDTQDDPYISDSHLNKFINIGYKHVYNRVVEASEDFSLTSTTFSTSVNTSVYALPSDMKQIRRIERAEGSTRINIEIIPADLNDIRDSSYPTRYIIQGNNIQLTPTPQGGETIRIYYVPTVTELSSSTDTPIIPSDHHEIVSYYAAMQIKVKEESDPMILKSVYNEMLDQLINSVETRQTQRSRQIRYLETYE